MSPTLNELLAITRRAQKKQQMQKNRQGVTGSHENKELESGNQAPIVTTPSVTAATTQKVNRIHPVYAITTIGRNQYEYFIDFHKEYENTIVIFIRKPNSGKKSYTFIVSLQKFPTPKVLSSRTGENEQYILIGDQDLIINSITKDGEGSICTQDRYGKDITNFNFFKNSLFGSPQGVHKDFLEIIKQFFLEIYHKTQQEKE